MTFKQLIDKFSFDEIIPELRAIWKTGHIYQFREAFDILRSMDPDVDDGVSITVHLVDGIQERYHRVSNMSGNYWEKTLGREIEVDSNCDLSEKQLLALCLWERTFYGFSPEQEEETNMNYLQDNPPKERDEIIKEISELYVEIPSQKLNFIQDKERKYFQGCFRAPVKEGVDYLIKSILFYSDLSTRDPHSPIVMLLRIPNGYCLPSEERNRLIDSVKSVCGEAKIYWGTREILNSQKLQLSILYNDI